MNTTEKLNDKPKYLYHYTSIENFALILKNKNIRFTSLNNVDDLTEGSNKESEKVGSYFFVSCWTDDAKESLPFWNMYTPQMKGVKIKLPVNLFKIHRVEAKWKRDFKDGFYNSIVPQGKTEGRNYWVIPTLNDYLKKVTYTDDENKLYPEIKIFENRDTKFNLETIGLYKSKHWEFQSEWRYILKIFPKPPFGLDVATKKWDKNIKFDPRTFTPHSLRHTISIEDFYLDINETKFKKLLKAYGLFFSFFILEIIL